MSYKLYKPKKPLVIDLKDYYKPMPKQLELHSCRANEILFGGAAGPGKSVALRWEALDWCLKIPGLHVYLFRRTYPELEDNHILASLREFPKAIGKFKKQDKRWEFVNGSMLHFCHCQYDTDVYNYQGSEIHLLIIDELTTFCVTDETEVLTKTGWKNIKDCNVNDEVMSLSKDNECEFKDVLDVYEFDYKGKILSIDDTKKSINFDVTPNHRMVTMTQKEFITNRKEWNFCKAEDLPKSIYFPVTGNWSGKNKIDLNITIPSGQGLGNNQNLLSKNVDMVAWCRFIGWYLAEGSSFEAGKHKTPIVSIAQYNKNKDIEDILNRLKLKYKKNKKDYRIFSRQLYEIVKTIGNSHTKRLPREYLELNKELLWNILDAYLMGDGSKTKYGSYSAVSVSKGLIDDLQELCVRLGVISTVSGPKDVHTTTPDGKHYDSKIYKLYVFNPRFKVINQNRDNIKHKDYEGKVYCIKVKDNENFLARTRGKIWWSGNSEFQYDYLRSRVRTTLNIPKKYRYRIPGIVCATNPGD